MLQAIQHRPPRRGSTRPFPRRGRRYSKPGLPSFTWQSKIQNPKSLPQRHCT